MNCLSGLPIFAGGVMGWWLLKADDPVVVYVLMVTAASFIYISVSDLFPFLHKQHRVENFAKQTMLLLFGLGRTLPAKIRSSPTAGMARLVQLEPIRQLLPVPNPVHVWVAE
jgi:hypothetical protein